MDTLKSAGSPEGSEGWEGGQRRGPAEAHNTQSFITRMWPDHSGRAPGNSETLTEPPQGCPGLDAFTKARFIFLIAAENPELGQRDPSSPSNTADLTLLP